VEDTGRGEQHDARGPEECWWGDAVREFNAAGFLQRGVWGPGGQVVIVTHRAEPVARRGVRIPRNNAPRTRKFLRPGSAPPFQRNQFGLFGGAPRQQDVFIRESEGLPNLHQTSVAFVDHVDVRAQASRSVQPP
jgi:hypothetical protein